MNKIYMSDVSEQIRGVSYKPEDVLDGPSENAIGILRANNISDGKINFDDLVYVRKEKVSEKQMLRKGDILICASSGSKNLVGKAAQIKEDCGFSFGAFCKVVRPKNIFPKFLGMYYQSSTYRAYISAVSEGANINNIKNENIDAISFPKYSFEEQQEISDVLSKAESIIDSRRRELEQLDLLIKARFVEMFGQGDYPQAMIADLVTGKVSTAKKDFAQDETIKYIDISSIDNKRNIMTGYTEYVLNDAPSRAQQHIKKDDIVISTVRPNLKNVALTTYEDENLVASSGFCVLRASKCIPEYLMTIVTSDKFTEDMVKVVTGANYPAIKDSDVMGYPVAVVPIAEQAQFADFVNQVDKSKVVIQKQIELYTELFDKLMYEYFG